MKPKSLTMFKGDPDDPPKHDDLPTLAWDGELYELFDLAADPGENTDLFERLKTEPAPAELIAGIVEYLEADEDASVELDDDLRAALEALGYMGSEEEAGPSK